MANNNNVQCPKCGHVFPNPVQSSDAKHAYVGNNSVQCRQCGTRFTPPTLSGNFDEEGNFVGLRSFLTTALTPETVVSLQALAQQAQANPEVRQNFAAEANKIAPGLGDKLNTYLGNHHQYTMTFLQTLMAILAVLIAGYALFKPDSPPQTIINNYNYYGSDGRPKTEQVDKPRPGKLGSNITLPKKPRKKRGKRT